MKKFLQNLEFKSIEIINKMSYTYFMFSLSPSKSVTSMSTSFDSLQPSCASPTSPPSPVALARWNVRVLDSGEIDPTPPQDVWENLKNKGVVSKVYCYTHLITGRRYFGSVVETDKNNLRHRFSHYKFKMNATHAKRTYIENAVRRSPTKFKVTVVDYVKKGTAKQVHQKEGEYIQTYGTLKRKRGYNQVMPPEEEGEKAWRGTHKKQVCNMPARTRSTRNASTLARKNISRQLFSETV